MNEPFLCSPELSLGRSSTNSSLSIVPVRPVLSVWPPWLLLLGLQVIFSPLFEGGATHVSVMVIRLLILALAGLWLGGGIRNGTLVLPSLPVGSALLVYLGLAAVSTIWSPYGNQSRQWLIVLLSYGLLLYMLVVLIQKWEQVFKLLMVLIGMGLFEAGWAVVQWMTGRALRPSATFFNPNFLAGYLAMIWVLVLSLLCYRLAGRGSGVGTGRRRAVLLAGSIGLLTLMLAAITMSGSRGGMVAVLVGTSVVIGLRFGRKGVGLLAILILLGLAAPSPLRERVKAEHVANPVTYARVQIWQSSIRAMADHPFGVGLGLYQYVYPSYALPVEGEITRYGKVAQTAHNEYLQMGVELGVGGLLVFCWGVVLVAREARSVLQQRLRRLERGVLVGLVAAIAATLVHAALDSNLHEPALAILLTLCVGIVMSARRLSGRYREPWRTVPLRSPAIWSGIGVLLIGVLAAPVVQMGFAWTFFEAGSQALAKQDIAKAVAAYRMAIALDSGKALYHSSMAAAYFKAFERTGEAQAAQTSAEELRLAMALNPLDGRLPGLLGRVYASPANAEADAGGTRCSGECNGSPARGSMKREDRLRAAASVYERAIELEPFTVSYRLEAARIYAALGNRGKAEASVRQAVDIEPNFLPGREWLAKLYLEGGRPDAADREYREILDRQQRYVHWAKNPLEEQFLKVDAPAPAAALKRY